MTTKDTKEYPIEVEVMLRRIIDAKSGKDSHMALWLFCTDVLNEWDHNRGTK